MSSISVSIPANVQGVTIFCDGDRNPGIFQIVNITPTHPIHRLGELGPVSEMVGLPIVVYRHTQEPWMNREEDASRMDNQIATYLMIEKDGYAGQIWQKQVGTVTVMRKDYEPLTEESMETIWMYHDYLLELFGEGDLAIPQGKMNRADFASFCRGYKEERLMNGYKRFQNMAVPL